MIDTREKVQTTCFTYHQCDLSKTFFDEKRKENGDINIPVIITINNLFSQPTISNWHHHYHNYHHHHPLATQSNCHHYTTVATVTLHHCHYKHHHNLYYHHYHCHYPRYHHHHCDYHHQVLIMLIRALIFSKCKSW